MPSSAQITPIGSGYANALMKSVLLGIALIRSCAWPAMTSRIAATRRAVKVAAAARRTREWSGGFVLSIDSTMDATPRFCRQSGQNPS
jgi:hypothetical protein